MPEGGFQPGIPGLVSMCRAVLVDFVSQPFVDFLRAFRRDRSVFFFAKETSRGAQEASREPASVLFGAFSHIRTRRKDGNFQGCEA